MSTDPRQKLTEREIHDAGLTGWVHLPVGLRTVVATGDFATGLALVQRIGDAAEDLDHHPDLLLSSPRVVVTTSSHDVGGVTSRDLELARRVSAYAEEAGARLDPAAVTLVELGLDTWERSEVRGFWTALLGGSADDQEVVDPTGLAPTLWWQETEAHETPRQRWHPDVWVDRAHAAARIEAAVAAGGTLVDDSSAPEFWVLADPQGNRACICTTEGRE